MSFAALATSIGGLAASGLGVGATTASILGGAGAGLIGGAGLGGITSALTGQDIGKGMLMGGLGGALTGGIGSAIGGEAGAAAGEAAQAAETPAAGAVASGGAEAGGAGAGSAGGEAIPGLAQTPALPYSPTTPMTPIGVGAMPPAATTPAASSLFAAHPMLTIGTGAMLAPMLMGGAGPTQATPPTNNYRPLEFFKFNPSTFKGQPSGYTGYMRPQGMAAGGIASLNEPSQGMASVDFMGQDAYPMSQQKLNFYSTPSQMPTSAQQTMASYEPATNPLTGEPVAHFDRGGIAQLAVGGKLVRGMGDGMSDDIPANIAGKQEARLADGEFVVPADVVSHLGNGSTDAGAKHLYRMMDNVRKARTGRKSQGRKINPQRHLPA